MSARMIRCRQGHVFDAEGHAACPICGETVSAVSDPIEPPPISRILLLSGAAFIAIGAAAGAWGFLKSPPNPVPIVVDDKTKGGTQTKGDDSSGKNGEQATASDSSPADNKPAAGTKASDVPANPIATGDRPPPQQQRQPKLDIPRQGANATPLRDFKEISRLLGVSDLVVDMTAFFTLKKKGGKQPSPEIISALDGLSKRGIGPASAELGIDYLYGIGVPQNDSTAISYLKTAVEQRQPAARFMLGQIYLDGKLITADPAKGSELLTLAVREGFQPAVQLAQKSRIDPARMGMKASQLIQMAISDNRQTVDASNAFINEGLASG